jgi:predicted  nucleic acid-binding Zn-ribbon protein
MVHFFWALAGTKMKQQLQLLWKLQNVEQQIEEAQKKQAAYPLELERLQALFKAQEEQEEEEKRRIEDIEKKRIAMEGELELENERIKHSQLKLLDIKTNKEYQALLKEIEIGKEHNSQREEEIINLLDEIDQLKADYINTVEKTHKERETVEQETSTIKDQMEKVEQDINQWHQTREKIIKETDPDLLKRYNTLKEKRNGIAVVLAKNEGCQGCYVNIPPQMYNEVQKNNEIILCPNCHRILYWENKDGE